MAPSKAPASSWDEEDSESTPPSSPPVIARRSKFEDEEEDSDVLESWDAADDSEAEREKAKKVAEAKATAEAAAKATHKTKSQRIEEKREANRLRKQQEEDESSEEEETEADRLSRMRESEKASDLKNAEDLFSDIGISSKRGAARPVTIREGDDPANTIDLSSLKLFSPTTVPQFAKLRETLVPLLVANSKKPQYAPFLQEFAKQIVKDLSSDQVKKISSALTAISNEKMKEEKAADKGGKKTKAAKTKATLSANRDVSSRADTTAYNDGLDEDDFM